MPENSSFQKVFEKNLHDPMKDMKVCFQSVPYNTRNIRLQQTEILFMCQNDGFASKRLLVQSSLERLIYFIFSFLL